MIPPRQGFGEGGGSRMVTGTAVRGLAAGLGGVAAMTVAEKLEQAITGAPTRMSPRIPSSGCWGSSASPTARRSG